METKEQFIIDHWNEMTNNEMAEKLGIEYNKVLAIMTRLRRHGKIGAKKRGGEKVKKFKVICEVNGITKEMNVKASNETLAKEGMISKLEKEYPDYTVNVIKVQQSVTSKEENEEKSEERIKRPKVTKEIPVGEIKDIEETENYRGKQSPVAWLDSKGTLTVKWLPLTKEETLELIEFVDKIKEITVR
jgi:hypothetical protein